MKRAVKEQLWGLSRTQAKQVTVRYDIIAAVLGDEIATALAVKKMAMAQKKPKVHILAKALEELENDPPASYGLATYNRNDLVSCMEEAIKEAGGLDKMFPNEVDTTTPLQKVRAKIDGGKVVAPPPQKKKEESK